MGADLETVNPAPEGYTAGKLLQRTERSEVYEGVRDSDGAEVILKRYAADLASDPKSRALREFELMKRLNVAQIPRALAVDRSMEPPTLVLERVSGTSLARMLQGGPLPVPLWLDLAIGLATIAAELHAARVIHKDLTPANVLLERNPLRIWICDFGLAAELGAVDEPMARGGALEGTLLYIAPEQSGRMNRGCDFRSDLYSLGATLYHACTGRPPFESTDVLELIHAHIARTPEAPAQVRADLPDALSRILLKLLRKEPGERYQSARALIEDLIRCREQWTKTGEIPRSFELGATESPDRPRFGSRLLGREREIEKLFELYAQSATGDPRVLWVQGEPGVGKSALINELGARLAQTHGYLARGTFESDRDRPYDGWVVALGSFVQQLLLESDTQLTRWRNELVVGLGNVAGALLDLIPDLRFILGEVPGVPALAPREARARLSLAVQRFIRICATPEHPLVLFLDDLQWSDAGSRGLLEDLLANAEGAVLVIGAYRCARGDEVQPLTTLREGLESRGQRGEEITLRALSSDAVAGLLAEALERSRAEVDALTPLIERKTGNNPLLIRQFVDHTYERGLLQHRHGEGWSWDAGAVAAADIPDGAVALMVAKISRLEPGPRSLIQLASCVGDEFDVEVLADLDPTDRCALEEQLHALSDSGLIAPCLAGFRFVHAGIREAALSLLPEALRTRLHYKIAELLLARIPEPERGPRVFSIVEHLNRGLPHLSEDLRGIAIQLNLVAGKRALATGAAATSEGYLSVARGLFREEDWHGQRGLGFDLLLPSAESAVLRRDFATALALLDELDRRSPSLLEATKVAMRRIQVFAVTQHPEDCARYALGALRKFGIRWPLRPSSWHARLALRIVRWKMRFRRQDHLVRPADSSDPTRLAPILMMGIAGGVMARVDFHLGVLASCWVLSSNLRHGFVARPGYSIAVYAGSLQTMLQDAVWSQRMVQLALVWNDKLPDPVFGPRTEMQIQALLRPWWMRRRKALEPLENIAESMREVGDIEYAHYAQFLKIIYGALAGDRVPATEQSLAQMTDTVRRRAHRYPEPERCLLTYRMLVEGPTSLEEQLAQSDAWIAANRGSAEPYVRTLWMMVLCVYGRYDLAFAQSEQLGKRLFKVVPYVHVADHTFYRGLAAAELARSRRGEERRRYAHELRNARRRLRRWSRSGPDFAHMIALLDAEHARLRGRGVRARALYAEAARRAREQEFIHHAALAHERRSQMHLHERRETEAASCMRDAIVLYEGWGAEPKVGALEVAHRRLAAG